LPVKKRGPVAGGASKTLLHRRSRKKRGGRLKRKLLRKLVRLCNPERAARKPAKRKIKKSNKNPLQTLVERMPVGERDNLLSRLLGWLTVSSGAALSETEKRGISRRIRSHQRAEAQMVPNSGRAGIHNLKGLQGRKWGWARVGLESGVKVSPITQTHECF